MDFAGSLLLFLQEFTQLLWSYLLLSEAMAACTLLEVLVLPRVTSPPSQVLSVTGHCCKGQPAASVLFPFQRRGGTGSAA